MARPRKIIPTVHLHLKIPEDLRTQMDLYLWSPMEQKVPSGAQSNLITQLLREFFQKELPNGPHG